MHMHMHTHRPVVLRAQAAANGVRLVKEGRVGAVKIEGGTRVLPHIRAIVDAGVAVMGHLGLTPQVKPDPSLP